MTQGGSPYNAHPTVLHKHPGPDTCCFPTPGRPCLLRLATLASCQDPPAPWCSLLERKMLLSAPLAQTWLRKWLLLGSGPQGEAPHCDLEGGSVVTPTLFLPPPPSPPCFLLPLMPT